MTTLALLNLSEVTPKDRMTLTEGCTADTAVLVEVLGHKHDVTLVRTVGYPVAAHIRVPNCFDVLITEDDIH